MRTPSLVGILNITEDSFSDGGRFLAADAAIAQAKRLLADGADIVELGPAASNPDAAPIDAQEEIRRLDPVISWLAAVPALISVDSFAPATQRYALSRGVDFLNDIQGFPESALYPALASGSGRLVVMHAVQQRGAATRIDVPADGIWDRIARFFEQRIASLEAAGIRRERLILDPGMGFFLSSKPDTSVHVLATLPRLKRTFGLPVLVSVSRKSFLRTIAQRDVADVGAATVAAELWAAVTGADYIRTHDPRPLADGLRVLAAIARHADGLPLPASNRLAGW